MNDVILEIESVTPCLRTAPVETVSEHLRSDLVPHGVGVVAQDEMQVDPEAPWREYVVLVTGSLDPGRYTIEIFGENDRGELKTIRLGEPGAFNGQESSVEGEPMVWACTLRGPALDRFVMRLVCLLEYWKPGTELLVAGDADSPLAGMRVRCEYDTGDDDVPVRDREEKRNILLAPHRIPRKWLSAVPTITQG